MLSLLWYRMDYLSLKGVQQSLFCVPVTEGFVGELFYHRLQSTCLIVYLSMDWSGGYGLKWWINFSSIFSKITKVLYLRNLSSGICEYDWFVKGLSSNGFFDLAASPLQHRAFVGVMFLTQFSISWNIDMAQSFRQNIHENHWTLLFTCYMY